ncbi:CsgG/HfaB family protein [Flavobacterium sp. LB2R40]|uniref:CsgG/HfaB family protein n=1 Tax=unclassified Flavobacterium TaxID=196869 RepID=UPI003AADE4A9
MNKKTVLTLLFVFLLSSCGAYFNQPVGIEKAIYGENTPATSLLTKLPKPKEQIVVGVYKFKDQTGQYKAIDQGSTFSTAVTQGATSILIKALGDSKWFVPIERENLGNLLNERNIIRSTRQEYATDSKTTETQLTPLLFAGVLLEGGIISYDSNIITGGFGARYFGTGGSTRYRQDRISIYLRLVSTSNGKILNTVYVSKTILSQSVDANLFKYVNIKRLLEVETGFTRNEPIQLAVTEAIEKAVEGLIVDGIKNNLWEVAATSKEVTTFIDSYTKEKEEADLALLYGRNRDEKRGKIGVEATSGVTYMAGDYPNPIAKPMLRGAIKYFIKPNLNLSASSNVFRLGNKGKLDVGYASLELNLEYLLLPYDVFTPYFFSGFGASFNSDFDNLSAKVLYGAGIEYLVTNNFGLKLYGEHNLNFSDNIDYVVSGVRDDYYWRFGFGMTYYFHRKLKTKIK